MKQIFLTPEMAKRWYNSTDAELKELALQTYPELGEKQLPKSWEELIQFNGYYVTQNCKIANTTEATTRSESNKSSFATKEQAEASIALAQLSQLMKVYNGGWVADFEDRTQDKYTIEFAKNLIWKDKLVNSNRFLSFKDFKTRDLFLENFKELILKAKPLL